MEDYMFLYRYISQLLLSICCFASLQADFIDLQVWRRITPLGESQYIICCGDQHNLTSMADKQSDDLIEFLNQRNNPHDIVLIEDITDCTYIIEQARAYFKANIKGWDESCLQDVQLRYIDYIELLFSSQFSALNKMSQKIANKKNIKSLNVDFRTLSPVTIFSSCFPAWKKFLSEDLDDFIIKGIVQEVQNYNDCPLLNEHYKKCIFPFLCMLEAGSSLSFKGVCHTQKHADDNKFRLHSSLDYYHKDLPKTIDRERWDYMVLIISLMDARILHHIYQKQIQQEHENVVVVCAGFGHILGIKPTLSVLGYERIYKYGASLHDDYKYDDFKHGLSGIAQSLKDAFDSRMSLHIWLAKEERRKQIERQAKIERRIKHILSGLDDNIMLDLNLKMCTGTQKSPAKLQAKL